jgi:hypothetical protein
MNNMPLAVALFVYPPTLDDTKDRDRGIPDAKAHEM